MIEIKDINQDPSMELFSSKGDVDPKLRTFLEEASSMLCKWLANANKNGPLPELFDFHAPLPLNKGVSRDCILNDIHMIMDNAYQPSSPGAIAHLDPPPLTASIVGDLISAGLNNNLLAEELSPSLSLLEEQLCKWIANKLGMNSESTGVAVSGGSISNLMGLVLARNKANLSYEKDVAIISSSDAHVSIEKSTKIMGLPPTSLFKVSTNSMGELSLSDLEHQINRVKYKGLKCMAIVATAGTTVSGSVDPLVEISKICALNGIWLHIDAAIGGVFGLSDSTRSLVDGLKYANSVTINPQKILGIAKTSSILLVSKGQDLSNCFSTGYPYLSESSNCAFNGGEMTIQGSRSAEILKLWLGLRQLGEEGIASIVENCITRRIYLEKKLRNDIFKIIRGPLHIISFRPANFNEEQTELWSLKTKQELLKKKFMLSRPFHNGKYYLKAVLGNPYTTFDHLDHLSNILNSSVDSFLNE